MTKLFTAFLTFAAVAATIFYFTAPATATTCEEQQAAAVAQCHTDFPDLRAPEYPDCIKLTVQQYEICNYGGGGNS